MTGQFSFYLALVVVIVLLIMVAGKIRVAYPVLLVVAGLLLSFLPDLPQVHIDPELIFIIFLPPLLYEASWTISWKELWFWRRIISSFAFVVVFLTAMSVAFVANAMIPGFSIALGFMLGGIVSPPDAVSAGAILKFVRLPKAMSSILEGESLLNDASSLIIMRFALITVGTGQFIWYHAAGSFLWMVVAGVAIGLLVGVVFMNAHKYLPTDSRMDVILSLATPYVMYIAAEKAHASGVLAVVSGGLLLSNRRHLFLSGPSILRGVNVWESLVFLLNGLVFLLIGLDLPEITAGLDGVALSTAIGYGLLISAVLMVGRILTAYGAVIFTMIAKHFVTVADTTNPGLKRPFVLGWAGMRGVVSLAAALSIPLYLADGRAFPQRNLIIFITFVVILTTLVVQGLSLPFIIRAFKIQDRRRHPDGRDAEEMIRKQLAEDTLAYMQDKYPEAVRQSRFLQHLEEKWKSKTGETEEVILPPKTKEIYLDILNRQRRWLHDRNQADVRLDEDIIRRHLHKLDIEEERLRLM